MQLDPTNLFLIWLGGGFVIMLAWAALVGQALMGGRPAAVRPAIGALAVIGVFHPVAAISAVDLVRLGRTMATSPTDDPSAPFDGAARSARARALALPDWAVVGVYGCAVASVFVAIAAFVEAGGLP